MPRDHRLAETVEHTNRKNRRPDPDLLFRFKGMSYGDGHTLSTAYDNRLRPTTWNVSNVLGYNYAYDYFNEHTGRVSYAQSIYDSTLDRSYEYDLVGRLDISHTGAEARAAAWTGQWGTLSGPPIDAQPATDLPLPR